MFVRMLLEIASELGSGPDETFRIQDWRIGYLVWNLKLDSQSPNLSLHLRSPSHPTFHLFYD